MFMNQVRREAKPPSINVQTVTVPTQKEIIIAEYYGNIHVCH